MKKTFLMIACSLLVAAGMANATSWNWDLSSTGVVANIDDNGYSSYVHFDSYLGFMNNGQDYSTIIQSLTGGADDTILDKGDTFTDFGVLKQINVDSLSVNFKDSATLSTKYYGYIEFSDLSGYIDNVDYGSNEDTSFLNYSTNIIDDSYELVFTPGSGTIKLYLDTDFNSNNGAIELAEFSLIVGEGTSPEFLVKRAEGQFGLVGGFIGVAPGVWSFEDGTSFEDWMTEYGIPSIFLSSFNLGATFKSISDDGTNLLIDVFNHGDFELTAVPEPSTFILFGGGMVSLFYLGCKRKNRK